MKEVFLVIFFISISLISFTQSSQYYPFPTGNAVWRESFGGYESGCSDYQFIITGDTVINNYTYHNIRRSGVEYYEDEWGWCTWVPMYYFNYYWGAFRNDSINKRVYFHDINGDTLLYDFDLNLGDTLPITYTNLFPTNYVKTIDSILIGDEYHKRYGIASFYDTTQVYVHLIEGIGSTFGLLSGLFVPFEFGSTLECFILNGETLYPDTNYSCNLITGINNKSNENQIIQIYPNPIKDNAIISIKADIQNTNLLLFDVYGQEVFKIENLNNTTLIDRSDLSSGLYIYRLVKNNRILCVGRLIVL